MGYNKNMGNILKLLIVIAIGYWGYQTFSTPPAESEPGTYVEVPMPQQLRKNHVMVVAAVNCPKKAAQHANFLARRLKEKGIAYQRVNQVNFELKDPSEAEKLNQVMRAGPPVVFYNRKAMANPSETEMMAMITGK